MTYCCNFWIINDMYFIYELVFCIHWASLAFCWMMCALKFVYVCALYIYLLIQYFSLSYNTMPHICLTHPHKDTHMPQSYICLDIFQIFTTSACKLHEFWLQLLIVSQLILNRASVLDKQFAVDLNKFKNKMKCVEYNQLVISKYVFCEPVACADNVRRIWNTMKWFHLIWHYAMPLRLLVFGAATAVITIIIIVILLCHCTWIPINIYLRFSLFLKTNVPLCQFLLPILWLHSQSMAYYAMMIICIILVRFYFFIGAHNSIINIILADTVEWR